MREYKTGSIRCYIRRRGASEQESAFMFAEVTWKVACGGISPAVTYRDHVSSYLCEGKWRDHPYVLH